jgi:hypothetical protein
MYKYAQLKEHLESKITSLDSIRASQDVSAQSHLLEKQSAKPSASDVTFGEVDYPGSVAADYIHGAFGHPVLSGYAIMRGETARSLAQAAGLKDKDLSFTVKSPNISTTLSILGGGVVGGGAGLGVDMLRGEGGPSNAFLIGALGGALTGGIASTVARRNELKRIEEAFNKAKRLNLKPLENTLGTRLDALLSNSIHPGIQNAVINQILAAKKGKK